MKILPRKTIRDLRPYEPGKPIEELERELSIKAKDIVKLASNENPLGPSPKAVRAILKAADKINRYPDGGCFYLKRKLAAKLKLKTANIVLGNGSDELIDIITKTFLEEKEEAIISEPSFLEYKIITKTRGSKIKIVPMKGPSAAGFEYDVDKILKSVSRKTKIIFFGNPDNPTGAFLRRKELIFFLKNCPKRVIVVFDEAYRELIERKGHPDMKDYIDRGNIIVLRTFSKTYGLAGLRIGYAITSRELTGWMERARQPFNVNMLAQAGALAALDDKPYLAKTRKVIKRGRSFLCKNLKELGFEVIDNPANFILFSYKGVKGSTLFKKLLPCGIIIRDMKPYGLTEWARVNVGTSLENKRFVTTLEKIIPKL